MGLLGFTRVSYGLMGLVGLNRVFSGLIRFKKGLIGFLDGKMKSKRKGGKGKGKAIKKEDAN